MSTVYEVRCHETATAATTSSGLSKPYRKPRRISVGATKNVRKTNSTSIGTLT